MSVAWYLFLFSVSSTFSLSLSLCLLRFLLAEYQLHIRFSAVSSITSTLSLSVALRAMLLEFFSLLFCFLPSTQKNKEKRVNKGHVKFIIVRATNSQEHR